MVASSTTTEAKTTESVTIPETPTAINPQQSQSSKNRSKTDLYINFKNLSYLLHINIFFPEIWVLETDTKTTAASSTATEAPTTYNFQQPKAGKNRSKQDFHVNFENL